MVMMDARSLDNDTRGWIMCIVSGIACVVGASIICVDVVVRLFPGHRRFAIQENNKFLASSLSLSFGVMSFSALYSMLPSSKRYLIEGGYGDQAAGFIMMGAFVAGFIGIQVISRILHQFMPSHVVDCDHTHDPETVESSSRRGSRSSSRRRPSRRRSSIQPTRTRAITEGNGLAEESTPLLTESFLNDRLGAIQRDVSARYDSIYEYEHEHEHVDHHDHDHHNYNYNHDENRPLSNPRARRKLKTRPSLLGMRTRVLSFVRDTKTNCDEDGPCYGYTDPCGQECFKHLGSRVAMHGQPRAPPCSRVPTTYLSTTTLSRSTPVFDVREDAENGRTASVSSPQRKTSRACSRESAHHARPHDLLGPDEGHYADADIDAYSISSDKEAHHHHVPTNGFLAVGVQTVIAIALHKFPEGFITYATNHANPDLGFNVFMALFVHNIAEGFAMALPLYMALNSRLKAILWSTLLGGLSQPLGAAVAVAWFKIANRTNVEIDNVAYACLFAITAGIMTSVALQLFVESLSLNHNRNLSIGFAFLGMTLLGVSNAFVA